MPAKIRPGDWDRLFAPNAPRRGGPLRALVNVLIIAAVLALLGGGSVFAMRYRNKQIATANATATAVAPTIAAVLAQRTATAAQATATVDAARTATAVAKQPTPEVALGTGVVLNGGNLRQEAPDGAVIGVLAVGDEITFLQEQEVGGQTWFHIRIVKPAANRGSGSAPADSVGWASATLLSAPTPVAGP